MLHQNDIIFRDQQRTLGAYPRHLCVLFIVALFGLLAVTSGCNWMMNGLLDPSQVGNYFNNNTVEIRSYLSLQDEPETLANATEPQPGDLVPIAAPYRITYGDQIQIRILDLLMPDTETSDAPVVDNEGMITLPILGRLYALGLTPRELEQELINIIRQRDIVADPLVNVSMLSRQNQTCTIFGQVQAPSIYPIPRPDFRLLEAMSISNAFLDSATEIYIVRRPQHAGEVSSKEREPDSAIYASSLTGISASDGYGSSSTSVSRLDEPETDEEDLIRAIAGSPRPNAVTVQPESQATNEDELKAGPALPRYKYVDGKWVETTNVTQPQTGTGTGQEPPQATPEEEFNLQPFPEERREPAEPAWQDPFGSEPEPTINWGAIAGDMEQRVIRVSPQGLRDGDPRQNIIVRPGDSIRVIAGEVGEYYIMGQVNRPGSYSLTGRRITLKQAIAAAGNISPLGWPDRCTLWRRHGDQEEMKQLNLDAIFAGDEPDLFLKKDDLIVLGSHPVAPFLAVLRNSFRMTYGFGFVYDRNFADRDSYGSKINPENVQRSRFPNLF